MKKVLKSFLEPRELQNFRHRYPNAHWDKPHNGCPPVDQMTSQSVLTKCLNDQKKLCAYCEIELAPNGWPPHQFRLLQRVEHYLAKSGHNPGVNLHLHWPNLLVVCTGGTQTALANQPVPYFLIPVQRNQSCDASKNTWIQKTKNVPAHLKKIDEDCTGYILDPTQLLPLVNLFRIELHSGRLIPHPKRCSKVIVTPNYMGTTEKLVQNTIDILNLNCSRLTQHRLKIIQGFNRNIKIYKKSGKPNNEMGRKIAKFYFSEKWPAFFTTIRCLLGNDAEKYLYTINYQG